MAFPPIEEKEPAVVPLMVYGPRLRESSFLLGFLLLFMVELLFFPHISAIDCLMLVPLDG